VVREAHLPALYASLVRLAVASSRDQEPVMRLGFPPTLSDAAFSLAVVVMGILSIVFHRELVTWGYLARRKVFSAYPQLSPRTRRLQEWLQIGIGLVLTLLGLVTLFLKSE
jgi:hypothetical protein